MEDILDVAKDEEEIKVFKKYIEIIKKEKGLSEKEIIKLFKDLKEELESIVYDTETIFEILLGRLGIKKEEEIKSVEKKIKEVNPGEYVIVKGKVISVRTTDKIGILKIYDETGSIKVITFEPSRFRDIYEGSTIKIIDGFVRETDYGKEIVVGKRSKIEIIEKAEFKKAKLSEINENDYFESIVFIAKVYEPKVIEKEIEKEGEKITIERPITTLLVTDETKRILAYFEGRLREDLEGKTVLIRGRAFTSKSGDLRINLRTLIEVDSEEELLKEI